MATPEEIRRAREATAFGGIFNNLFAANCRNANQLVSEGRRPVLGGLASKQRGVAGTDTLRFEGFTPFFGNLLDPVIKGFDASRAASQGLIPEEDMLSEATGMAALATGAGGFAPKPSRRGRPKPLRVQPKPEVQSLFPEDVYHYSRNPVLEGDVFDTSKSMAGSVKDSLGVHVGTKKAAEDRFDLYDPSKRGVTLPLKARMDRPFLSAEGKPFTEFELSDFINAYQDNTGIKDRVELTNRLRKDLTDAGFTHIPYRNEVEDAGSMSAIMLTNRTAGDPAVLRSRFAAFQDEFDPRITSANRSKLAGALAAIGDNGGPPLDKPLTKEQLDPLGYQKTKMRRPFSEVEVQQSDLGENLARKPMSWENMEGNVILPFYGDRTSRGLLVEGVNDYKFDAPVYTEGGVDFKVGPAAQKDRSIWASNQNIITRLSKEADKAQRDFGGRDILGVTGSMAPDANDFATFTGEAAAELVKGSKITKKTAKEFDATMKALDPTFVGLLSPDLRDWVKNTSSPNRKSFIRLMDSRPMQDAGLPSPAEIRKSVTDPTQYELPAGMFGLGVSRIDTGAPLRFNTPKGDKPAANVPHSTYNTQITGDYLGSLPPVPQRLIFKDVYDAISGKLDKRGNPLTEANMTHAIKTKMPAQELTPQIIDGILNYLARQEL
jgi:hypothetical protein